MNWRFLAGFSLVGLSYGLLTVFALISGSEYTFVTIILLAGGALVGSLVYRKPVLHRIGFGFACGFLIAITALCTQALFMPLYLQNNPEYAQSDLPFGLSEQMFTFLLSPVAGVVFGLAMTTIAAITHVLFICLRKLGLLPS